MLHELKVKFVAKNEPTLHFRADIVLFQSDDSSKLNLIVCNFEVVTVKSDV